MFISNQENQYVVEIYNKQVLRLLKENDFHPVIEDRWADIQKVVVEADSRLRAIDAVHKKYPKGDGFVVSKVIECAT